MSVKQRLIEFLKYKKLGQKKFAQIVGISDGYVNAIRVSIQPGVLHKIAMQFPDLNTGWLLTGEGEMLKPNNGGSISSTIGNVGGGGGIFIMGHGMNIKGGIGSSSKNPKESMPGNDIARLVEGYEKIIKEQKEQIQELREQVKQQLDQQGKLMDMLSKKE